MQKLLFLLLFILPASSYAKDGSRKMSCRRFHTGKFYMDDSLTGRTIIDRHETYQRETVVAGNFVIELKIRWTSECTYILTFSKVISDPGHNTDDIDKSMVLTNEITDVTENSYTQNTSAPGRETLVFTVMKMK